MEEEAGPHPAYEQGMAGPRLSKEQMQTMQQEVVALRDISNQTHLQVQQLQEANRCANDQLQQWADHSRLQAEQLAAFQNREVEPHSHGDANGPRNLNKPGGRSIRFESCDGRNSETTKAWFAMSRTRLLATGIDPNTKDAVLHLASFFTGPLGRWWTTTIRNVDDACGNFGSVAELEAAAMSLHYVRDPCRTAYNKLAKLKQTRSVHDFIQSLEELHFHLPERSAKCRLNDFIQGLKPFVRTKIVVDYPSDLETAVRRALEIDDNNREVQHSAEYDAESAVPLHLTPSQRQELRASNACFSCHRIGHTMKHCPELVDDTQEASSDSDNSDGYDKKSRDDYDSYAYVSSQHDEAKQVAGSLTSPSKTELRKAHACFHCHRVGHKVKQCPELSSAAFDRHDSEQYDDGDYMYEYSYDRPEDNDHNSYKYGHDYDYENDHDNNNDEQYGKNKSKYGRDYYK